MTVRYAKGQDAIDIVLNAGMYPYHANTACNLLLQALNLPLVGYHD